MSDILQSLAWAPVGPVQANHWIDIAAEIYNKNASIFLAQGNLNM